MESNKRNEKNSQTVSSNRFWLLRTLFTTFQIKQYWTYACSCRNARYNINARVKKIYRTRIYQQILFDGSRKNILYKTMEN